MSKVEHEVGGRDLWIVYDDDGGYTEFVTKKEAEEYKEMIDDEKEMYGNEDD